jgi:hypothetical protein
MSRVFPGLLVFEWMGDVPKDQLVSHAIDRGEFLPNLGYLLFVEIAFQVLL